MAVLGHHSPPFFIEVSNQQKLRLFHLIFVENIYHHLVSQSGNLIQGHVIKRLRAY